MIGFAAFLQVALQESHPSRLYVVAAIEVRSSTSCTTLFFLLLELNVILFKYVSAYQGVDSCLFYQARPILIQTWNANDLIVPENAHIVLD